jgi:hypothetical protein
MQLALDVTLSFSHRKHCKDTSRARVLVYGRVRWVSVWDHVSDGSRFEAALEMSASNTPSSGMHSHGWYSLTMTNWHSLTQIYRLFESLKSIRKEFRDEFRADIVTFDNLNLKAWMIETRWIHRSLWSKSRTGIWFPVMKNIRKTHDDLWFWLMTEYSSTIHFIPVCSLCSWTADAKCDASLMERMW